MTGETFRIRGATAADSRMLAGLNRVLSGVHARHWPELFEAEPEADAVEGFFRRVLAEPAAGGRPAGAAAFVAEEASDGAPIGYALARVTDHRATALTRADTQIHLEHLAVLPEAARRGVATALLDSVRAFGRSRGCRLLTVTVWAFNGPAHEFYRSAGLAPMHQQLFEEI